MISIFVSACSAVTRHHLSAISAEKFCCQQIFFLASCSAGSLLILVENMLDSFKQFIFDYPWHTAGDFHILVKINSDVTFVSQNTVQTVFIELFSVCGFDLSCIQISVDFCNSFAACITLVNLSDNSCCFGINIEFSVRINLESQTGQTAVRKTFLCVDIHSSTNLLRKLCRIIFRHTFENTFNKNSRCIVRYVFLCGDNSHAVLFQFRFVDCTVISVSCKSVKLINKHRFKSLFVAVSYHLLKCRSVIRCSALRSVDILINNIMTVGGGILITNFELTFD